MTTNLNLLTMLYLWLSSPRVQSPPSCASALRADSKQSKRGCKGISFSITSHGASDSSIRRRLDPSTFLVCWHSKETAISYVTEKKHATAEEQENERFSAADSNRNLPIRQSHPGVRLIGKARKCFAKICSARRINSRKHDGGQPNSVLHCCL